MVGQRAASILHKRLMRLANFKYSGLVGVTTDLQHLAKVPLTGIAISA
jgi:hypothetical protein